MQLDADQLHDIVERACIQNDGDPKHADAQVWAALWNAGELKSKESLEQYFVRRERETR